MGRASDHTEVDRKIRALTALLRYPLSLPIHEPTPAIDLDMAEFACRRHRVGQLLFRAAQLDPQADISPAAQQILAEVYQHNIYLQLKQKAVVKNLHSVLSEQAIPCFFVKGGQLGAQLYDDPHLRLAKDVDAVVPTEHIADALTVLSQAGYQFTRGSKTLRPKRDRWRLWANKDMPFIDPKFGQFIELHERLIHLEPAGLTARVIRFDGTADAPPITHSPYVLYLILHAVLAYFRRLKWVVDLSSLLRRLPAPQKTEVFALAKEFHCMQALIAALQFTEDYFPDTLDNDWKGLIAEHEITEQTDILRDRFARGLCGAQDGDIMTAPPMPYFPIPERVIFEQATMGYSTTLFRKAVGVLTRR
ncbi:nucleotidyltransferase family protein [Fretibacter rubidus]|uniref:nucleotidyltransferase family protein n=1 Tax=Fretibacter rubidus TaxID=570162 RepID=UPI00352B8F35